jgi:hypothetical protein
MCMRFYVIFLLSSPGTINKINFLFGGRKKNWNLRTSSMAVADGETIEVARWRVGDGNEREERMQL